MKYEGLNSSLEKCVSTNILERGKKERKGGYRCWYPHFTKRYCLLIQWEIKIELYSKCIAGRKQIALKMEKNKFILLFFI